MDPEALPACASLQGCLSCPVFTRAEDKAHDRHWSAVCMYVCVCVSVLGLWDSPSCCQC